MHRVYAFIPELSTHLGICCMRNEENTESEGRERGEEQEGAR